MMSPPAKTASRYTHVAVHSAMFSKTSVSLAIHPWTSSLNGATYRGARTDPVCSRDSSSNSLIRSVSSPLRMMGPRCLNLPKDSSLLSQSPAMLSFLASMHRKPMCDV